MKPIDTDTTIMTPSECAAWLKVRPRQLSRLGVPSLPFGRKTVRYLKSDVLAWLNAQRPRQKPRLVTREAPTNAA